MVAMDEHHSNSSNVIRTNVAEAVSLLRGGGIVAIPTETVYGLAAITSNTDAIARIFEIKQRPRFDPLIVHVHSEKHAQQMTQSWNEQASILANAFWPGPLTLVLPRNETVPDLVTAGLPTVAIRIPDHPMTLALLESIGEPIAAPSANPFGAVSPTSAAHVAESLGSAVDLILDGGPCRAGVESTILDLSNGRRPRLLRPGSTPVEEIESLVGKVELATSAHESLNHPKAPGMLKSHYATRTPLHFVELTTNGKIPANTLANLHDRVADNQSIAVLAVGGVLESAKGELPDSVHLECLTHHDDLREAAANLFGLMRLLDDGRFDLIVAIAVSPSGLGRAINDRLCRASQDPDSPASSS